MPQEAPDATLYAVVVNHEEQYSIWPAHREPPAGWERRGPSGPKEECLDWIESVWTDMRPLSLRKQMEAQARAPVLEAPQVEPPTDGEAGIDDLVARLCHGEHPVVAIVHPRNTTEGLAASVERGHVLLRFTDTRGGTELGVRLDETLTDTRDADFGRGEGILRLAGDLRLNYVDVRCLAKIDVRTLQGSGHLVLRDERA